MKISVYAIAKDEEANVAGWVESAREADSLHILDTGSIDNTLVAAHDLGVDVGIWKFDPFRFDEARNFSLSLVHPDTDLCIALDLDERLQPGWRSKLEQLDADVTRPRYRYTWSWDRGRPGLQYAGDKIHARHGYVWKHPVHEVIVPLGEERQAWCDLEIHHHPDPRKSRGHYLDLLALSVHEDPADDRNAHYYARELYFAGQIDAAYREFQRHLSLPSATWGAERAQSLRYLFKITGDPHYLEDAIREAPGRREPLMDAAVLAYEQGHWRECLTLCKAALAIEGKPLEYLTEAEAYGPLLNDLAAIACHHLGYHYEALHHGMLALKANPYDERLVANLRQYKEAAA